MLLLAPTCLFAESDEDEQPPDTPSSLAPAPDQRMPVRWGKLLQDSAVFLGVQHGFRIATEQGTRDALKGPFLNDWGNAIGAMHGWTDGDPASVNYIGHPMMGSISNYIWINNDPEYRYVRFGTSRRYWTSRLRSAAFGFAFSAQFEIGPLSEATIGNVQKKYPAQGFQDWIITPAFGFGLVLLNDFLDRYVVEKFEDNHESAIARAIVRSAINPSRAFANAMAFKKPWDRENRAGVRTYLSKKQRGNLAALKYMDKPDKPLEQSDAPWSIPSRFDVDLQGTITAVGAQCVGAGGTMLYNFKPSWSVMVDGSGCKLYDMPQNFSGDVLGAMAGIRYTLRSKSRLQPYFQVKAGAGKMYQRERKPLAYQALLNIYGTTKQIPNALYPVWAIDHDSTAGAIGVGGGLKLGLTRALSLRLAGVDYVHTWLEPINGRDARNNLQITTGFEMRFGSW